MTTAFSPVGSLTDSQSLIRQLRDPTADSKWEQTWRHLAPLGRSVAALLGVSESSSGATCSSRKSKSDSPCSGVSLDDEDKDEYDVSDRRTTILGTFLGVNASSRLDIHSVKVCLRSRDPYDCDIVMTLLQRAAKIPSIRSSRYLYPLPLSAHIGATLPLPTSPTTCVKEESVVIGISTRASQKHHTGLVFGVWVIAPTRRTIATFGIDLRLEVSDPLLIMRLHVAYSYADS